MVVKKEGLFAIVVLFALFLNINAVTAGTYCADNQIIMRLSSATNAHGEVYNGAGSYPVEICYDDIFGTTGDGDRVCSGTNKVVGLSASTNAHAESPSQSNYGTSICYGDLLCTARSGSCVGNESLVVSLSSTTNAHLSNTSSYTTNICCTAPGPAPQACTINSASWDVTETIEGNVVDLEVITSNCQGLTVSFEIRERDALGVDDAVNVTPMNVIVALTGTAVANWTAEYQVDEDLPGEDSPPEYFFTATIASAGEEMESTNELIVQEQASQGGLCQGTVICADYANQQECENDICLVANVSVGGGVDCNDPDIDCECVWNSSAGGSCFGVASSGNIGSCAYSQTGSDTCDDGLLSVTWLTSWTWDPTCDATCQLANQNYLPRLACLADSGQQDTLACPTQIPLPFFTIYNVIITLVVIALIYWLINSRKGKKKR